MKADPHRPPAPGLGPAVEPGRADPVDPDVDLSDPSQRAEIRSTHGRVLLAIAAGGILGSLARYQAGVSWPTGPGGFPWTTLTINVVGCFLIGVLMVQVIEHEIAHPLLRPFVGTGVLGGFTTFSTYSVDIHRLLAAGHAPAAFSYLVATAAAGVAAAALGLQLTRRITGRSRR